MLNVKARARNNIIFFGQCERKVKNQNKNDLPLPHFRQKIRSEVCIWGVVEARNNNDG